MDAQKTYESQLSSYLKDGSINPHNKKILERFIDDINLDKFTRNIGPKRRLRYINTFRNLDRWFKGKNLEKITTKEFGQWYLDLKNDKIRKENGKPYSQNSKGTYIAVIKLIWKWLKGSNEVYPEEVRHFKKKWEKKTPQIITIKEAKNLANSFHDQKYKFATLFLFDSGFRVEEFLTMKRKNIRVERKNDGSEYFLAECTVSKTFPRTISVHIFPEVYNEFLKQYHPYAKPDDALFPGTYAMLRKVLGDKSREVLGVNITPQSFRRSSATHFASILKNAYKMNQRYGWRMGSNISEAYINAAGIPEEENVEAVEHNKVIEMERQMRALQQRMKEIEAEKDEYKEINDANLILALKSRGFDDVAQMVREGKDGEEILAYAKEKQAEQKRRGEEILLSNLKLLKGQKDSGVKEAIKKTKAKLERIRSI